MRVQFRVRARVRSGLTLSSICWSMVRLARRTCSTLCEVRVRVSVSVRVRVRVRVRIRVRVS